MKKTLLWLIPVVCIILGAGAVFVLNSIRLPLQNPVADYLQALECLTENTSYTYNVQTDSTITVGNETFREAASQTVTYLYENQSLQQKILRQKLTLGNSEIQFSQIQEDDTIYTALQNAAFRSTVDEHAFSRLCPPLKLISEDLYTGVTGYRYQGTVTIQFENPIGLEDGYLPTDAQLIHSSGCVTIDKNGNLSESKYTVQYQLGEAIIESVITTTPSPLAEAATVHIGEPSEYVEIDDPTLPITVEKACGFLLQATKIESHYEEIISYEAFGDERIRTIQFNSDEGERWSGKVKTETTLRNTSHSDKDTTLQQTETVEKGKYEILIDGQPVKPEKSSEDLRVYCRDLLVSTVIMPQYIAGVEIQESDKTITFQFAASEILGAHLEETVCRNLYNDPTILASSATSKEQANAPQCYLTVHKETGLPVTSGIRHCSVYYIKDLPYQLIYDTSQTYRFTNTYAE